MKLKIDDDKRYKEPQIHSPPEELSAWYARGRAGNADERRYIEPPSVFSCIHPRLIRIIHKRLFNLFWINVSWQKRLTAEDAENRRGLLFFSASLGVLCGFPYRPENNKKSLIPGGRHMTVTIAALWDQLYFSDTDLHGSTQINGYNNIINIFRSEHSTTNHQTHSPEAYA